MSNDTTKTAGGSHPLDPLTRGEIGRIREILTADRDLHDRVRYVEMSLDEPEKTALRTGTAVRRAHVVLRDAAEKTTYEATVSLDDGEVVSWTAVDGVQPAITIEEAVECEKTVKAHPEWREAVAKRGVEDVDLAMVDPWSAGNHLVPDDVDADRRLAHGMTFVRTSEDDNGYARPLDSIHAWVDLDEMAVVKLLDRGVKVSNVVDDLEDAPYRETERDLRTDLKPYNVDQPEGPSWTVDGRTVEWQRWHLRVGWSQREGLVLHDVGYEDDGEVRPILHRASCAEMSVPYGTRDPNQNWKNAFDVGEYNIGRLANALTEGCDCLGYMHYFDGVMADGNGDPVAIPNAVCLHEEDFGTLWKHTDWRTEQTEVRRNRRLVVSWVATVGNYDYQFNWYFYQDGSVEGQVRLTGVDSNGLVAPDEDVSGYGELLAPGIKGMIHQHFFNFRLDLDVDGETNDLYRVQNQVVPAGPDGVENDWPGEDAQMNPAGQAFYAERTRLQSEQEAQELTDPHRGRYWLVTNPEKTNALGRNVGYKLVPGENVKACAQPESSVHERATFIDKHLWATPYAPSERFPAGEYPNQHSGGAGLPAWTAQDRSLEAEDLVLWYTLGVNHVTRPEDWPILPVHMASFKLEPVNFFDENPAIDVPPEHAIKDIQARRAEKYDRPEDVAGNDHCE